MYKVLQPQEVRKLLEGVGLPAAAFEFFYLRHEKSIASVIVTKGTEVPFSSKCDYLGAPNNWTIDCTNSYTQLGGNKLEEINGNFVINGSDEFKVYTNEIVGDFKNLDKQYIELQNKIQEFFGNGRSVQAKMGDTPLISAKFHTPVTWTGDVGFLGHQSKFETQTKYQDFRKSRGTFCGYAIGSPSDDIVFLGNIYATKDALKNQLGEFTATVEMRNRSAMFQNKFQGCGMTLTWTGAYWKGSLSPIELRSTD